MAKISARKLDPDSKLEIVYFEDKFGAKSQIQHPLSRNRAQRNIDEAAWMAQLEQNETAFDALVADQGGQ